MSPPFAQRFSSFPHWLTTRPISASSTRASTRDRTATYSLTAVSRIRCCSVRSWACRSVRSRSRFCGGAASPSWGWSLAASPFATALGPLRVSGFVPPRAASGATAFGVLSAGLSRRLHPSRRRWSRSASFSPWRRRSESSDASGSARAGSIRRQRRSWLHESATDRCLVLARPRVGRSGRATADVSCLRRAAPRTCSHGRLRRGCWVIGSVGSERRRRRLLPDARRRR